MNTQARRPRRTLVSRIAAVDDGAILKAAFFAMLAGAVTVLAMDYFELDAEDLGVSDTTSIANPVLPAVERPEIDPDDPALRPRERVSTPHEVLSAPLELVLGPGGVLALTGTIGAGAASRFAEEVEMRGDYIETVALDSPGGSVDDALAIARLIAQKGYDTAVGDGALCASSCPLVLAAGKERIASDTASVGVHQIYAGLAEGSGLGVAQAMSDAQTITARISRYLAEREIDSALWVHALETPPDRLYYLTIEEMRAFGLITR